MRRVDGRWREIGIAAFGATLIVFASLDARAGAGESSFTPISLKIPIRRILVADQLGATSKLNATLYECTRGDLSECLIDVADNTALKQLLSKSLEMKSGTYAGVSVRSCTDSEGGYTAWIKGSVTLSGTTYYTTRGAAVLSTQISDWDEAPVRFTGCNVDTLFPEPFKLESESTATLNLFLSIKNIAFARLGAAPISEGCSEGPGAAVSLCVMAANVLPSLGKVSPRLKVFHLRALGAQPETAGGQVLVLLDELGRVLGGYTRRLFSSDSLSMSGSFDTFTRPWTDNGDGTYSFESVGSTLSSFYLRFGSFRLEDHDGTYSTASGATVSYTASEQ